MNSFIDAGVGEDLKALVHGGALVVSALMAGYSLVAWLRRRERHLAVNAALYTSMTLWEGRQMKHHLDAWRNA